jgi:HTH-type transcriptional regulator/antitoxin HigA
MNIEQIPKSWRNIAHLLIPVFSEEDCDRRKEQLKN